MILSLKLHRNRHEILRLLPIHAIVYTGIDHPIPLLDLPLELRGAEIRARTSGNRVQELDNGVALVAHHLLFLGIPQHRDRRPPIVAPPPHPVHLSQRPSPIGPVRPRDQIPAVGFITAAAVASIPEPPGAVGSGGGDGDGEEGLEVPEGADEEGAVGPGAGEGDVEVEGRGRVRVRVREEVGGGHGGEGAGGAGVGAGGIGGGELAHHEEPRGGPGGSDGGDEGLRG